MKETLKLLAISVGLSFISLVAFHHLVQSAASIFYFGFPFIWYEAGIADIVGSFQRFTFLNALADVMFWSAVAFLALFIYHRIMISQKNHRLEEIRTRGRSD